MPTRDSLPSRQSLLQQLKAARQRVAELERASAEHGAALELDDATISQTLLCHLPDYVYFKDRERRFLRVSLSFEELLGRPIAEIIGRRDEELLPPEIARDTVEDDRRVIEQGLSIVNKLEGGEVGGAGQRWVLTTKLPWRDDTGAIRGLFGLSRDVTQQKELEDELRSSERRLRVISETVPFPVAATSIADGRILYANQAFADFLAVPLERLVGSFVHDYYVDPSQRDALIARVREEGRVEGVELNLRRHDGAIRTAASAVIPLEIDGVPALMGAGADVTELKERESELRELSAQKDLLLSEVNHRVRNNLAALAGLVRQQMNGDAENDALRRIDRAVQALSKVHTMLSESGWQPLEVRAMCRDVIQATLGNAAAAATLRVSGAAWRAASQPAHQLALVMAELATNTLKHARPSTRPTIDVTIVDSSSGVSICYRDDGPGFPEDVIGGARGLGLRLVDGLVGYGLSGSVALSNDAGAVTTLHIPALVGLERATHGEGPATLNDSEGGDGEPR